VGSAADRVENMGFGVKTDLRTEIKLPLLIALCHDKILSLPVESTMSNAEVRL
jgi:hypothetical protein